MGKRLIKAIPWIDVTCGNCGAMVGRNYKNGESVARLKNDTRLWRYDTELGMNLCNECLMKLHRKGE